MRRRSQGKLFDRSTDKIQGPRAGSNDQVDPLADLRALFHVALRFPFLNTARSLVLEAERLVPIERVIGANSRKDSAIRSPHLMREEHATFCDC